MNGIPESILKFHNTLLERAYTSRDASCVERIGEGPPWTYRIELTCGYIGTNEMNALKHHAEQAGINLYHISAWPFLLEGIPYLEARLYVAEKENGS